MQEILYQLFYTHFTQTLMLMTIMISLPLEKKARWKIKTGIAIVFSIVIGGVLEASGWFSLTDNYLATLVVYPIPLLISYLYLEFVTVETIEERLYSLSLAYLSQHMASSLSMMLLGYDLDKAVYQLSEYFFRWGVFAITLVVIYFIIIRKLAIDGHYRVTVRKAVLTFMLVMLVAMGLNIIYKFSEHISLASYNVGIAYDILCCFFILLIQLEQKKEAKLWAEIELEKSLSQKKLEQYEKAKSNVEIINQKCHDIKHSIAALRNEKDPALVEQGLQEMEQAVLSYDALAETGNEVLDTLLSEKGLICEQKDIQWTCMANGKLLDFMTTVDLYTLLGNALDNAIESALQVFEKDKRIISLIITQQMGMVLIQIDNYYSNPVNYNNGEIITSKKDTINHGFGLKSIQNIVEKYHGMVDISTDNNLFRLTMLIPRD